MSQFLPQEWIDRHEPVDDIEPLVEYRTPVDHIEPERTDREAYREAARKFKDVLRNGFRHIGAAIQRSPQDMRQIEVAYWQVCFALGLGMCAGKSMTEVARNLGVERATISKGATMFCRANGMPSSFYMKKEESTRHYQEARINSIKRCNGNHSKSNGH